MKTKLTTLIIALFSSLWVSANNITVSNVSLENYNETENWVNIQCDITWENSWRLDSGPSNWDAIWLFAKYRVNGGIWRHVTLDPSQTSTAVNTYTIDVSADNKGAFVYRSSAGSGTSLVTNALLGWDLAANGIDINSTIEVKVFAIEMVYVPQGSFYLGGSGSETDKFTQRIISSENEIKDLTYGTTSSYAGDGVTLLPAAFPKGYNAFYCMKYEISEEQYVAFFNTLEADEQPTYDLSAVKNSDGEVDGNTFSWLGVGTEATTSAPDRACSYLNYNTLKGYLGWSALRPMTELEYEKAARGPYPGVAVAEAYAWGNSLIKNTPYNVTQEGTSDENINGYPGYVYASNYGSAAYDLTSINFPRPLRCGIFSFHNISREVSGASYYGIMELSGNVAELVLSAGSSYDREYTGGHGAGYTYTYYQFGSSVLAGIRGGGWASDAGLLRIADRTYGGTLFYAAMYPSLGGRGVRTAN